MGNSNRPAGRVEDDEQPYDQNNTQPYPTPAGMVTGDTRPYNPAGHVEPGSYTNPDLQP